MPRLLHHISARYPLKQRVGYMLWPKYSKYEYCYKFSNSKIRDFGTGRGGKLESY